MRKRVVVTGLGMVNPLGHDVGTVWEALLAGKSGVGNISVFDASRYPTKIAAEVRDWSVSKCGEDPETWKKRGRHANFAAGAATQAINDSGIMDSISDPGRIGVYFGAGEGSSVVILEELEHAQKRGAQIYGEVMGYGCTADAYRITDIHPEGRGAIGCMQAALDDAGINADAVGYVNAHGTSTTVNDKVETVACKAIFGDRAPQVPVSSTKSMMGHLIAAAGVSEMIVCLLAIRDNVVPPTINLENPDPLCDLDYVPGEARQVDLRVALNNSFGFGGQNVTLAVGQFDG